VRLKTRTSLLNHKYNLLINQFRRENESWRRTLIFLIEEDIILKAGISEILKNMNHTDEGVLKKLEHFHGRLLNENDTVRILRTKVSDMEKQLNRDYFFNPDWLTNIKRHQVTLRKEIEKAEMEFQRLKFDFNDYIDGILQNAS
jgi:hypothetical protein